MASLLRSGDQHTRLRRGTLPEISRRLVCTAAATSASRCRLLCSLPRPRRWKPLSTHSNSDRARLNCGGRGNFSTAIQSYLDMLSLVLHFGLLWVRCCWLLISHRHAFTCAAARVGSSMLHPSDTRHYLSTSGDPCNNAIARRNLHPLIQYLSMQQCNRQASTPQSFSLPTPPHPICPLRSC